MRSRHVLLIIGSLTVALAWVPACKRQQGENHMPPAKGAGAPPMVPLPVIGGEPESKTVAPTEGRTTGTTFPRAEAQVGPNAGGVIARIFVKEGDRVRKGMVLFRQNTGDAELRVQQARTALEAAKLNLRATETEHQRTKSLFEQSAANQMTMDQMQSRLDSARIGVQQAQVALGMANKSLADGTVRSPIDGLVTNKLKNEGEMATTMPPTVVLVVQDQSVLELRFRLPERSLTQVKVGDVVTARLEALGSVHDAKVVRIQPAVDPRTRTVEVVAEIPNKDGTLKSGLLAEVELAGAKNAQASGR